VTSTSSTAGNVPLERLLIVLRPGSFGAATGPTNTAGQLGNRNLGEIVPHLYARLPPAFAAHGVQARMVSEADLRAVSPQPGEKQLWIQADHAVWSSRGGQVLVLGAELFDTSPRRSLWRGEIRMGTPGFGKFDDSVADSIGQQLVQQLQTAHVVVTPGAGAAIAASPANATQGAAVSAVAVRTFASIEDVDAIPFLGEKGREDYRSWLRRLTPRAFAISEKGRWYSASGTRPTDSSLPADPTERALLMCARAAGKPCKLYAVNGAVVWKAAQ
jgi:hypothetical protein